MKIAFGADRRGFALKNHLLEHLKTAGFDVEDLGPHAPDSVDYTDFAHGVAMKVTHGNADRGVLVCGSGIGMAMAANRHKGARAVVCRDTRDAKMARNHNDANILCLGGDCTADKLAEEIAEVFFAEAFDGGRHERRVHKIDEPGATE